MTDSVEAFPRLNAPLREVPGFAMIRCSRCAEPFGILFEDGAVVPALCCAACWNQLNEWIDQLENLDLDRGESK